MNLLPPGRWPLASLSLLALLVACRQPLSGRYALVSIDGAPVPTGIEGGPGDTLWVYEGSIEFRGRDTALRAERTAGWRQVDSGRVWVWLYQVRGDSIMLAFDCAPNMICPGPEAGVMRGDSLVLQSSRFGDVRLFYALATRVRR